MENVPKIDKWGCHSTIFQTAERTYSKWRTTSVRHHQNCSDNWKTLEIYSFKDQDNLKKMLKYWKISHPAINESYHHYPEIIKLVSATEKP